VALRKELRDPLTPVLGGLAGGLAWAVGIAVPPAIAIGLVVAGAKIVAGLFDRKGPRPTEHALPPIPPGSPAGLILARSERAARSYRDLGRALQSGPLAEQVQAIGRGVVDVVERVRHLGGQAQSVEIVLYRLDLPDEGRRYRTARAREAEAGQRESWKRIESERDRILGEMESAAAELEELVAKVAELVAGVAAGGTDTTTAQLGDLADRLDGLRQGLDETERITDRIAGEVTGAGTLDPHEQDPPTAAGG
jgi:hypothetical protein